jgi:DNA mismatch repair protein MSH6
MSYDFALPFESSSFQGVGQDCAAQFRKDLSRLPDMERLLARLFSSW